MKQKLLTSSAALALATLAAWAAPAGMFPPTVKPSTAQDQREIQRVSPNLEKESGIMMYACTNADGTMYTSWTSFRSKKTGSLTRYFQWLDYTGNDEVFRTNVRPAAGAYNPDDGKYYVMLTFVYDTIWGFGSFYNYVPEHWYSIDLDNGATAPVEIADLTEWSVEQGYTQYSVDADAPHWGLWMDMSFDPVDKTMYAMAQSEEEITAENPYHSAIVQVSLTDGDYTVKKELTGRYYLGFTYDLDGNIYAARWTEDDNGDINGSVIVELDRETFEEKDVVADLTKDGSPFRLCYNGTLDVDRATGELYYAGADYDNGRQYMFKVNPKTGDCEYLSSFSFDNIVGMHIPYVGAESRKAPARVSNLHTEFAADGADSITIHWTNPSTQWNLEDLTSIDGVRIYRDDMNGEPVAVVNDVVIGEESSYIDNDATQGLHTYYVIPFNENGNGISDSVAAWVGKDTPDAPRYVDGYGMGASSFIYWSAPETGLHDGWFDNTTVRYTVTRSDGVVIAKDITDTYVFDNMGDDVPMMMYTYRVTSSNDDGEGGSSETLGWIAGAAYQAPYTFDFNNPSELSAFTGYPTTGGWPGWSCASWMGPVWYIYFEGSALNETLLTPQIQVKAGRTYRVRWTLKFGSTSNTHTYELTAGATPGEQTAFATFTFDEKTENVDQNVVSSGVFTAEADGKYQFGLHMTSSDYHSYEQIQVCGMSIEEVLDNDLQTGAVNGFPRINKGTEQNYAVTVYNGSRNDQTGFKVQTGYTTRKGDFEVLGEASYDGTLASDQTVDVPVPTTVNFESGTRIDLCGRVVLEGDDYTGNDICPAMTIIVEDIEGADAFNAEFVGDILSAGDGYGDTNVPFTTYKPNTKAVTIYPISRLSCPVEGPYVISRIGFRSFNKMNISPCDVKVYMGTTDSEMFTGSPVENAIYPEDLELVFDGQTTTMLTGFDCTSINLDTPFEYDGTDNLVVALDVTCDSGTGGWNIFWNTWDMWSSNCQSIKTNASEWDFSNSYPWAGMPDMYLAVRSKSSVGINKDTAMDIALDGRTVLINGNARTLDVYDLAGRLVAGYNVNGRGQVALDVPGGVYLVKAVDAAGNASTLKAVVR